MKTRDAERVFNAGGELAQRCAELDWSSTPLGDVSGWRDALRSAVRTVLASPFPTCLWCGRELVLIYNDAYRHVLGAKHPQALGRSGREVWREIWPDIRGLFRQIRQGGPSVYAEDAPFRVARAGEAEGPADEPNAWFTFSLSPVLDGADEVVAFLNVVSETTGRVLAERANAEARVRAERAEAQLREVFAHAPAFLAVLRGEQHVVEYVNAAYYQLVGEREIVGRPLFEALPDVRGQGFEHLLDEVLATGVPFVGREVPVKVLREGQEQELFLDLVYYPVTENGRPAGVVAHGSDVTAHVLARREAMRARARAEEANQAKSHFLANMSHEIRTPINAVVGYTDLLDAGVAGPLTDQQHAYLGRIKTSSEHLLALVNDVLDLSKIEAGEMPVALEEARVREVVASAVQMVAQQARDAGLVLREEWHCEPSIRAMGDAQRVRQVVLNLLSNAVKFTPAGGFVTVRCRVLDASPGEVLPGPGPWVVIEVEDTGTGIPGEQLPRIFEPFVQADSGPTRQRGGTGLGLTISRRLARLMGGDLTVRSTPGTGSCFSLWLAHAAHAVALRASAEWARAEGWPETARELPGLAEVGEVLLEATERLQEELVQRLRLDPELLSAKATESRELADHAAAVLSVMAKTMTELDESSGQQAALQESQEILSVLSAWHGRQRRRLGWSRADIEREYQVVHDLLDNFLRREVPKRTVAELGAALGVVHVLIDRAEAASLAAYVAAASNALPD